ncbi:MAG TPA: nuclear transport factor 2 family protein [Acetobacteraceae bacterium]|nr:nuclear transport factor 2 family protein [Acetobacteraceae bacterium]
MTQANHAIVHEFFAALSRGSLPSDLLAPDMTAWTALSGTSDLARFRAGIELLASLFAEPFRYTVDSLTAEEDRVAAEVRAAGTLIGGEHYGNRYVFMFRIREGKIASVAEHTNVVLVREKLAPLLAAAMARTRQA